jgi:hypothetical protein
MFCFLFFTSYILASLAGRDSLGNGNDYFFHYWKAKGAKGYDKYQPEAMASYPPFYAWISSPFSFNERTFYLFSLFILCFIVPFSIIKVFAIKNIGLLYFLTCSFIFVIEIIGAFPQAIATILLLWFIKIPTTKERIWLILLGFLIHQFAFILLIGYWIMERLFKDVD